MSRKIRNAKPLAHPANWGAWLAVFVLYLLSFLPMSAKQRWGAALGRLLNRKFHSRRKVAQRNVSLCFPEMPPEEQRQLVEDSFIACSRGVLETTHAWWRDMKPHEKNTQVFGIEHAEEAVRRGKGLLLIGAHYSIFDFALPLIASRLQKPGYMYRPNDNPVIDRTIEKGRRRHYGIRSFNKRQLKEMMAFLADGGQVWYACDQDFGKKSQVFTPFFGIPAACITTPSFIARESGASVICVSHLRTPDGGYQISFSPIQENFGQDPQQDTAVWNGFIEATIRRYPEQYLWMHKRFKTRPEGEGPVY
ncbi:MAG: lipid A biosynthesis acyltransferase [Halomonadaceae bacterium]|nr:MAG: lipid A biosynthesis acyltransferase [Halomonadaceae bacterium]